MRPHLSPLRTIAALYVEKGGAYYGIPGCYFVAHDSCSRNATQGPRGCEGLSCRTPSQESRGGEGQDSAMARGKPWPQRAKCEALAGRKSGEGCCGAKSVARREPRKGPTETKRVARAHRLQSEAQRAGREHQATTSFVWFDSRRLRAVASNARRGMRDLRVTGARHEARFPSLCRSLPRHRSGSRTSLPSLQHDAWLRSGQAGIIEGGSVLP